VPGYTRRQLKEDKFAESAQGAAQWATSHNTIVIGLVVLFLVIVLGGAGMYAWRSRQIEKGNDELAAAIRTFSTPIQPAGAPAAEGPTFTSVTDRAKAAEKQFQAVADKYSWVAPGKIARYMHAVTLLQGGDKAGAEQELKKVADSGDKDVAALAKMALASIYLNSNRQGDAVKIFKDLSDHPTNTVSKSTAQLELAEVYEKTDPEQAKTIYQQLQKDDPRSLAAQVAAQKLQHPK